MDVITSFRKVWLAVGQAKYMTGPEYRLKKNLVMPLHPFGGQATLSFDKIPGKKPTHAGHEYNISLIAGVSMDQKNRKVKAKMHFNCAKA